MMPSNNWRIGSDNKHMLLWFRLTAVELVIKRKVVLLLFLSNAPILFSRRKASSPNLVFLSGLIVFTLYALEPDGLQKDYSRQLTGSFRWIIRIQPSPCTSVIVVYAQLTPHERFPFKSFTALQYGLSSPIV